MHPFLMTYLDDVQQIWSAGNATEHSYRPALKALVESLDSSVSAVNEPRRVRCGAPDFIVTRQGMPVGYVECKDIGTPLDSAAESAQLRRYFESIEHLVLTDYLAFRYYIAGELRFEARLARPDAAHDKMTIVPGADAALAALFAHFLAAQGATVHTPQELASRMAGIARVIHDAILLAFQHETSAGSLHGQFQAFRATLLNDMTAQQFADMYAQTICYGMFSARVNVPDQQAASFSRQHAAYDLPATNPFLQNVFTHIAGPKLDDSIAWAVDLLAEVLRRCDMAAILKDFGKATRQEDPVVHFYESFLAAYDPELRETRGVYYTPEPVVGYIVRSIDAILKRDFGCPQGLADNSMVAAKFAGNGAEGCKTERMVHRVQILDPATGTGTFLYETVQHIYDSLGANRGLWTGEKGYAAQHLLPRLHGFELMMAPYAVAHLKLGWLLKETGYSFPKGERVQIYLTNALEEAEIRVGQQLYFAAEIANEANAASRIKTETPIMVVLGNPPYSGHSANRNEWSARLIKDKLPPPCTAPGYFECDGKPLSERNPKWLNDDYVKFLRFGQYRIELTGHGILAFITNHGYLDNPTFRGMRRSLMETFDDIYLLDLHGNVKKKEQAPDGSKDENVFDIQQGVAIGIFVKRKNGKKSTLAAVRHAELWGIREAYTTPKRGPRRLSGGKYHTLNQSDVNATKWTALKPSAPHYLFVPQDIRRRGEYEKGWRLPEIMPVNSVGIVTARDKLTIHFTKEELWKTVREFIQLSDDEARERFNLGKDVRDWRVAWARKDVEDSGPPTARVRELTYRPFDKRWTYYSGRVRGFICKPRGALMRHMFPGNNLGIATTRSIEIGIGWEHVLCTRDLMEHHAVSLKEVNYLYPLYLYVKNGDEAEDLEELMEAEYNARNGIIRRPNLAPEFVKDLSARLKLTFVPDGRGDLKKTFGPEDVFHYIYAVFHSPAYRQRYAEFLKIDFPRVPLTTDRELFRALCRFGAELVGLHLLERVPAPRAGYPVQGNHRVSQPRYKPPSDEAPGRVYINDAQYFEPVDPAVWEFRVGGYQVCEKWLKDRKGRALTYDDITHYQQTTEAIRQTLRLLDAIDAAIPGWPLP